MQCAVCCGVGLTFSYCALLVQDLLDFAEIYFPEPFSRAVSIAFGNVALHVVSIDEIHIVAEFDHYRRTRGSLNSGMVLPSGNEQYSGNARKQQSCDNVFYVGLEIHRYSLFLSSSVIGPMNLSMLPAPKVTSTSRGSLAR